MKLSEQLRAMSHNPYSYPSPRLNEVMQQAADALEGKSISDEEIATAYHTASRNMPSYSDHLEKLVPAVRECLEKINEV